MGFSAWSRAPCHITLNIAPSTGTWGHSTNKVHSTTTGARKKTNIRATQAVQNLEWKTTARHKAGRKGTASTPLIYAHNDNVHVPVCYCVIRVNIKPDQTRPRYCLSRRAQGWEGCSGLLGARAPAIAPRKPPALNIMPLGAEYSNRSTAHW